MRDLLNHIVKERLPEGKPFHFCGKEYRYILVEKPEPGVFIRGRKAPIVTFIEIVGEEIHTAISGVQYPLRGVLFTKQLTPTQLKAIMGEGKTARGSRNTTKREYNGR